ncbi:hypothetical protein M8C21_016306, partial [Ambrosia artemisiifolia]
MASKGCRRSSFKELEKELMKAGKKLSSLPSSTQDIHNLLTTLKQILSKVEQTPLESMNNALHPMTEALIAKQLLKHPDLNVNISVACCCCEMLRICAPDTPYNDEQLKDIFEMVVTTFETLSSASDGCFTEMVEVLDIFRSVKLHVLILDLDSEAYAYGLFVRLFKQFLTVADSNSSAIVLKMEEIMTMIIDEADELKLQLVDFLVTFPKNNNKIASHVCWQLGQKVLMNYAARSKPQFPDMGRDMSIALYDYSRLVASVCKTISEYDIKEDKEATHRIATECIETLRRCRHEEKTDFFDDPPKSVTEDKGKRKRNNSPLRKEVSSSEGGIVCVQGYKVKQSVAQILEAVFNKHGDIAANCIFEKNSVTSSVLEVVCEAVQRIQTSNFTKYIEEIECHVSDAETANIDVTWLRAHFNKKMEVLKKSDLLMEAKRTTLSVKEAAQLDLKESAAEIVAAQKRFGKSETLV